MAGGVDGLADRGEIVDDARRGIDLDDEDRFDRVLGVGLEARFDGGRVDRLAAALREHFDFRAHQLRHLAPADREATAFEDEDVIPAREHVGERAFPAAVSVGGIDVAAASRAEEFWQIGEQARCDAEHVARIEVDRRPVHGLEDFVRDIGRTGYRQELAAVAHGHGCVLRKLRRRGLPRPHPAPKRDNQALTHL